MNKYKIEHKSRNVQIVRFTGVDSKWYQWVLLTADRHHDNLYSLWNLEKRHLDMARERNALIYDMGDLFCAMQGKFDPRKSYDELRVRYKEDAYFDEIVKDAAMFYGPYADLFQMIGHGNHETSILKHNGTDLTGNLVHRLNSDYKGNVQAGGYGGWVKFQFEIHKTMRTSLNMKYYHGSGGGGPVTRGVIQSNRQAVIYPSADIVVNGHTHDSWYVPIAQEILTDTGVITRRLQHHIRTSTYKDEHRDGSGGHAVEKDRSLKPLGCVWLKFYPQYEEDRYIIKTDVIQDVI